MTRIYLVLFVLFASCKSLIEDRDKETKVEKNFGYRIIVDTWNGFSGKESKWILDNTEISTYDSTQIGGIKPLTLYYIDFKATEVGNLKELVPIDTIQISFTRAHSDIL